MPSVLRPRETYTGKKFMKTEAEIEATRHLGGDEPGTVKGDREPPETGRDKEGFFPGACRGGHGPVDPRFQTSDL